MTDTDVATTSTPLPQGTPEEHGVPSSAILEVVRRWEDRGLDPHGVTVLRHGHVLAEGYWAPYHRGARRLVYSVSKTFTACAVGLAVGEGLLRLEDRVVDLFPEAAHVAGPRAAALTLHDLLAMRTGHRTDTLLRRGHRPGRASPSGSSRPSPRRSPGWFVYNNGATLMAGLAVQRASGQRLLDYLRPRLFDPARHPRRGVAGGGRVRRRASPGSTCLHRRAGPRSASSCCATACGRGGGCCPRAGSSR